MELIGKLRTIPSAKIEKSLVSIGFECLDRELFRPEKCYDLLGASSTLAFRPVGLNVRL